jgi:hypothetical protein
MTQPDANGHYAIASTEQDRAVLVGIDHPRDDGWDLEEDLAELSRLTDTAGARVVATITQRLERPRSLRQHATPTPTWSSSTRSLPRANRRTSRSCCPTSAYSTARH